MTARELLTLLENFEPSDLDTVDVVVVTADGGFCPALPCVEVKTAANGFDWDSGRLLLYPETPLVKK